MTGAGRLVEQSVSFDEYKSARACGRFDVSATKEDVLMALFKEKGIDMIGDRDMRPTPPAEIITDMDGKRFVIRQIQ